MQAVNVKFLDNMQWIHQTHDPDQTPTKYGLLHDHPSCLCCPDALSMVGDSLSGNGCGSPNHI